MKYHEFQTETPQISNKKLQLCTDYIAFFLDPDNLFFFKDHVVLQSNTDAQLKIIRKE